MTQEKATVGKTVADNGISANGNGFHPHSTIETIAVSLSDLQADLDDAKVTPADVINAKRVGELLSLSEMATYHGNARRAALDALAELIGYLPIDERKLLADELSIAKVFPNHAELERFLASCPEPQGAPAFRPRGLADLLAMPPKQYLIDQVIGAGDIGTLYGQPGSGKTFLVVDLIFAACIGRQWAMRFEVARRLQVAYCAGEGVSGLPARFAAAAEFYGVSDLPTFTFFDATPQFFDTGSAESIGRFVLEWKERQAAGSAGQLDLLVIDTLHSASVGADENSAQDMGQVLSLAKMATKELGCAVLLVHHSNKAGTGERGSSALRGAMDVMIEVKQVAGKYAMGCEKLKDGQKWKEQTFDLIAVGGSESVRVWWDEPGDLPSSTGKHSAALLAELQKRPGVKFNAKQLAEIVDAKQAATINALNRMVEKGQIKRALMDESKAPSNRNVWVYYFDAVA